MSLEEHSDSFSPEVARSPWGTRPEQLLGTPTVVREDREAPHHKKRLPAVQIKGLVKGFGEMEVLKGLDLEVEGGELLALLGPSGCGKTTLLRVLSGLETPEEGSIQVGGEVMVGEGVFRAPQSRRVGMVFQDWVLFPHMTVAENVGFGLNKATRNGGGRVGEMLELVGLRGLGRRYPEELSGGQAQRVALARALAPRPRVLLFDEPFSNLDAGLRMQVRADVAALVKELGVTSVFVTHDQEEAFVVGDRVAMMREGRIVQIGTPAHVYRYPASPWVASFLGEANFVDATAAGSVASTEWGTIPLIEPSQGRCRVLIRPEHLSLQPGGGWQVAEVEYYGHDTGYQIKQNGYTLQTRAIAHPEYRRGDPITVTYTGPPTIAYPTTP
ncbi:MAG: ABC transporter ATP-binding protein [Acidimicrobiia bacterium]|nr:ABC transporter ATP-binding protein [Acidimicrobiia bacterium]